MDTKKELQTNFTINNETGRLLREIGSYDGLLDGAFNLRENGTCAGRRSTAHISIENHPEQSGLLIKVAPGTVGEKVYIPACVTEAGVTDVVLNEILIGEGSHVTVVAGCGVHSDGTESLHNGLHRFRIGKNAHMEYLEKHIGTGSGSDKRINTETHFVLEEGASVRMMSEQIGGVSNAERNTTAVLEANATLIVNERLLTDDKDSLITGFHVEMNGDNARADVVSRSVARGQSRQVYSSKIIGNAACTGHTECDAILAENGAVDASPCLTANCRDAALIHEAAIGKIAGEQIIKLCTLGLTKEEAEKKIIEGFLK